MEACDYTHPSSTRGWDHVAWIALKIKARSSYYCKDHERTSTAHQAEAEVRGERRVSLLTVLLEAGRQIYSPINLRPSRERQAHLSLRGIALEGLQVRRRNQTIQALESMVCTESKTEKIDTRKCGWTRAPFNVLPSKDKEQR